MLGMEFRSDTQRLAWVGLLCVCAISMITRSIFTGALSGTPLVGLSPAEVIILFMGGMGMLVVRRNHTHAGNGPRRFDRYLYGFAFAMTVSFLYATILPPASDYDPIYAFTLYRNIMASTVVGYFLTRYAVDTRTKALPLMYVLMAAAILVAVAVSAGRAIPSNEKLAELGANFGHIALPFGMEFIIGGNTGALYILIFLYLSFSILISTRKRVGRILYGAVFAVFVIALIRMATRSALLIAPLGCLLIWVMTIRQPYKGKKRIGMWIISTILFAGASYYIMDNYQRVLSPMDVFQFEKLDMLEGGIENIRNISTFEYRVGQYSAYWDTILHNPFGYGIMGDYHIYHIQPHSLIIKLLMISGWFGLLSYLAFMMSTTWFWFRRFPYVEPGARALLLGMIAVNVSFLILSWGYDVVSRFPIQLNYILLCGLATVVAAETPLSRNSSSYPP
jgi:hypothetical protein